MYGLRSHQSVREGIVAVDKTTGVHPEWRINEYVDDEPRIVVYEPGNGTRYEILVTGLPHDAGDLIGCQEGSLLVAWLNDVNKCMILAPAGFLHYTYVMEKMHIRSIVDAVVLTELLGYLTSRPCTTCDEMREEVALKRSLAGLVE